MILNLIYWIIIGYVIVLLITFLGLVSMFIDCRKSKQERRKIREAINEHN